MAQEYIAMKENNQNGVIALSKSCFETIAKIAIEEEERLQVASKNGIFKDALTCKIQNNQLTLQIKVKVKYSANVNDACAKVQGKIFENIKHMCGYQVDIIDIQVVGFIF